MPPSDPAPLPRHPGEPAAPVPAEPPPAAADSAGAGHALARFYPLVGFGVLVNCLETGEFLKRALGLILPGNILGLFLLLALLAVGVVQLRWVEGAARWLLWLLPMLFMPIFVLALRDRTFWVAQGRDFVGAVAGGTLLLWAVTGHLAQWTLGKGGRRKAEGGRPAMEHHATRRREPSERWMSLVPFLPSASFLPPAAFRLPPFLLWGGLTVGVYFGCRHLFLRTRQPLLHPGFTGILTMVVVIECTGRRYAEYEAATNWINWLLGPAVVAMAVPIYRLRRTVGAHFRPLAAVLFSGLGVAAGSMALALAALGRPRAVVAAGTLKSVTSPVAYRLAVDAHVSIDATMAGVLVAGMLGATVGPMVLGWLRVRDQRAVGLALGCTSHGIGVARAMELGPEAGAYASLGMTGTAMLGALLLPFLLRWIAGGG